MTFIYLFNVALVIACAYAFWRGGSPERAAGLIFVIAATASYLVPYSRFRVVETPLFLVDLVTLLALTGVALTANRYWPLYVAAIQLLTVAIHAVKAYQPDLIYWLYNWANASLAYPTLLLLAIGTFRHRRRLVESGIDRDWSPL